MPPQQTGPSTDQLSQVADRLRNANSVLVTVSSNPSVDQLAACIGLTLVLNKIEKHGTAVFSGKIPSTIEFLKPEKTIEKDTNSLRDFIISLDKSKADKLRYKVEDNVVKIFITPYRTSISEKDFGFSQGDFNVDAVIALGVSKKTDLDKAITSHGRILHDATVISVNTANTAQDQIGSIKWASTNASSLCEMVADLASELDGSVFDQQVSTALLTGIVVETNRFSNEKSQPHTMQVAGKLMESGASTQLITTKLEEKPPAVAKDESDAGKDGVLQIRHEQGAEEKKQEDKTTEIPPVASAEEQEEPPKEPPTNTLEPPRVSDVKTGDTSDNQPGVGEGPRFVSEPPKMGGRLTANDLPEYKQYDPSSDPLSQLDSSFINKRKTADEKKKSKSDKDMNSKTLSDIEESVESPHLDQPKPAQPADDSGSVADDNGSTSSPTTNDNSSDNQQNDSTASPPPPVDYARDAVQRAVDSGDGDRLEPIQALGAQEFDTSNGGNGSDKGIENGENKDGDKPPSSSPPPVPPPLTPPPGAS